MCTTVSSRNAESSTLKYKHSIIFSFSYSLSCAIPVPRATHTMRQSERLGLSILTPTLTFCIIVAFFNLVNKKYDKKHTPRIDILVVLKYKQRII